MKIEIHTPTIRRKEMDAVLTAMVEEKIGPGERSRLLIQTAKEQLRFDYALALRSPIVALHLALKALDVKAGQGVIISALSGQMVGTRAFIRSCSFLMRSKSQSLPTGLKLSSSVIMWSPIHIIPKIKID